METAKKNQSEPLDDTKQFLSRSAQRASVYICYAPGDETTAGKFCASFEARGTPCWYSARDLTPAMTSPQCVVEAIESSKFFVLLLTDNACRSKETLPEVAEAHACGRAILVLQSVERVLNPELDLLLTNDPVLAVDDPVSDNDINAAWMKIVELESNSTWDDESGTAIGSDAVDVDLAAANSFLIQLECLHGSIEGKTSCQLAPGDRIVFGRGSEADVYVDDERASRRHAGLLVQRDAKYGLELHLMDLMSRNGTWVRYRREGDADISKFLEHAHTRILSGAIIRIGSTDIRVTAVPIPAKIARVGA